MSLDMRGEGTATTATASTTGAIASVTVITATTTCDTVMSGLSGTGTAIGTPATHKAPCTFIPAGCDSCPITIACGSAALSGIRPIATSTSVGAS